MIYYGSRKIFEKVLRSGNLTCEPTANLPASFQAALPGLSGRDFPCDLRHPGGFSYRSKLTFRPISGKLLSPRPDRFVSTAKRIASGKRSFGFLRGIRCSPSRVNGLLGIWYFILLQGETSKVQYLSDRQEIREVRQ